MTEWSEPSIDDEGYGYGLPTVYALWATALVILYFPCRAFAAFKERRRERWLSYL